MPTRAPSPPYSPSDMTSPGRVLARLVCSVTDGNERRIVDPVVQIRKPSQALPAGADTSESDRRRREVRGNQSGSVHDGENCLRLSRALVGAPQPLRLHGNADRGHEF